MRKLEKYVAGYMSNPGLGPSIPKKGDPQISALIQFLIDKFGVSPNDGVKPSVIIDFGSGNGVLASEIDRLIHDNQKLPYYIAVDFPKPLSDLALPHRIHNRSQKLIVDEFYNDFLPANGGTISAIVARNVLHEMDIMDTAKFFYFLSKYISKNTELYIQDMATLPEHERGKAGWIPEVLCELMGAIGINCAMATQESFGGTEWYIVKAVLPGAITNNRQIEQFCAEYRRKQHEKILLQISELNQKTDEQSATRLIQLQGDCASISIQLRHWENNSSPKDAHTTIATQLANLGIYINTGEMAEHDFCLKMEDDIVNKLGLAAILSNKSIIDFPAQYKSCKSELLLTGYSLRALFLRDNTKTAIEHLLSNGIPVKILLVDPDSEAAIIRSKMPSYSTPDEFREQVLWTINQACKMKEQLSKNSALINLELRLTHRAPPCSYFFTNNLCFLSLYSNRATGSRGQCFIYSSKDGLFGSYYHFLIEDFKGEWERSRGIDD